MTFPSYENTARAQLALAFVCITILVATPVPGFSQDGHDHDHDHAAEEANEADEHQAINLSAEELTEFNIVTGTAGSGEIKITISLPAEIHANDDELAHIVPRYEGIVTDVFAHVGDQVKVGQTLANIEGDASLSIYPLKTRIAGTVISKHITRGEAASRDRAPFVIADLSTVWLDIHVFQRDLSRVSEGQSIVAIAGPDMPHVSGTISYVSPVVDEVTRTSVARAVLDNQDRHWRPGMFVTASVEVGSHQADIVVPASALFTIHGHSAVFIQDDHGFEIMEVSTGVRNSEFVEILSGLHAGDTIVTQGGFTLKAELEKSTFGDGHNH
jgi:membrane fusion protein, heavy metal efflux system